MAQRWIRLEAGRPAAAGEPFDAGPNVFDWQNTVSLPMKGSQRWGRGVGPLLRQAGARHVSGEGGHKIEELAMTKRKLKGKDASLREAREGNLALATLRQVELPKVVGDAVRSRLDFGTQRRRVLARGAGGEPAEPAAPRSRGLGSMRFVFQGERARQPENALRCVAKAMKNDHHRRVRCLRTLSPLQARRNGRVVRVDPRPAGQEGRQHHREPTGLHASSRGCLAFARVPCVQEVCMWGRRGCLWALLLVSTPVWGQETAAAAAPAATLDLHRYDLGQGLETAGQAAQGIGFACLLFGGTFAAVGSLEQDPGFSSAGWVLNQISFGSLALGTPLLSAGAFHTSRGLRQAGFQSSVLPASLSFAGAAVTSVGFAGVVGREIETTEEWVSMGMLLLGVFVNQSLVSLQNRSDRPYHQQIRRHRLGQRLGNLHYGPMLSEAGAGMAVAGTF